MNKPLIFSTEPEVLNRLEPFGLTKTELLEVVHAAITARRSCTKNDPPAAPGWMSWSYGTRTLGEVSARHGYERDESDGISTVYDRSRGIKIAISNTDDGTGLVEEERLPQQNSRKGAATTRVVDLNEVSLFEFYGVADSTRKVLPIQGKKSHVGKPVFWYLCIFSEGDDVRSELSCPIECAGGYFAAFHERIILIGRDDNTGGVKQRRGEPESDSGFEINVVRKQG